MSKILEARSIAQCDGRIHRRGVRSSLAGAEAFLACLFLAVSTMMSLRAEPSVPAAIIEQRDSWPSQPRSVTFKGLNGLVALSNYLARFEIEYSDYLTTHNDESKQALPYMKVVAYRHALSMLVKKESLAGEILPEVLVSFDRQVQESEKRYPTRPGITFK